MIQPSMRYGEQLLLFIDVLNLKLFILMAKNKIIFSYALTFLSMSLAMTLSQVLQCSIRERPCDKWLNMSYKARFKDVD